MAALEPELRAIRALRSPPPVVQRTAQALLLLLGKRKAPPAAGWRWEQIRRQLRERDLLPRLATFDPESVGVEAAAALITQYKNDASLTAPKIARASAQAARIWRFVAAQLARVQERLGEGDSEEEQAYDDDDFSEDEDEAPSAGGRQLGDEESAADRALWREQQASTVCSGDFDYSILDMASVGMVAKFLGAGHGALQLQTKALEVLLARLAAARLALPSPKPTDGGADDDDEDEEEPETVEQIVSGLVESGGVQRCVSLLGAASLPTRRLAGRLIREMDAESEQVSPLLASGWVAGGAAGLLKENATGDGEGTVELGAATTIVSGEAAAGDRPWGLDLRGERVVASAAFVADYGEGLPLAEGMVCVGVEGKVGRQVSGAMVKAVANRLSAGLDRWEGRRLATLRWERDCAPPTATLNRIALSLSTLESAASKT